MKISKWVHRVATGRISHWNDINNQLVANICEKVETFEEPMRTALMGATISSLGAVDRMLGVEVGRDGWMAVDLLDVQRVTLVPVYSILIDIFLALDALAFPSMIAEIPLAKTRLFGKPEAVPHITALLQKCYKNTKSADLDAVSNAAWKEIAKLLNSGKALDPISSFQFHTFVLFSAKNNVDDLQKLRLRF
jgi:hypothetical protein